LQKILRVAIGLFGVLFMALAAGFLFDPARAASNLGVGPLAPLGLATLRGDLFAFFGAGGMLSLAGAVRNDARFLTAPLLMIAMTLAGRLVTVAVSGFDPPMGPPMLVEALIVVLLALGRRSLAPAPVAPDA
jgi:hypothetical protein